MIKSRRRMRLAGNVASMGEMRNVCKIIIGKSEWIGYLKNFGHCLEDNFKMDQG
jgi:hypothetical protein